MCLIDKLHPWELQKLQSWLPYAESFGYRTQAEPNYEDRLHNVQHYYAITAASDNVFRNIIQINRDEVLRAWDVYGKAQQTIRSLQLPAIREIKATGSAGKRLLRRYFVNTAPDFADELEDYDLDEVVMSRPFEIILLSALVIYALAFLRIADVQEYVARIDELYAEYEAED